MKIKSILFAVFASVLLLPLIVDAQQAEQGYLYRNNENGKLTITSYIGSDSDVVIPKLINGQPVIAIGDGAFKGNNRLVSITIPEGIESIGTGAFQNCLSLKKISLPVTMMKIGDSAFSSCSSLESIEIPASVTVIENSTFFRCLELRSVTFPKNLKSIGSMAFAVTGLERLELPPGVDIIGEMAFYGNRNLTKVTLPNSISRIDEYAFFVCENLSEVILPSNLSIVPSGMFDKCPDLSFAAIPISIKRINDDAFSSGLIKPESLKILGVEGSEAERFAARAGFPFEPVSATDSILMLQDGKSVGGSILAIDLTSEIHSFLLVARTTPDTMWPGVDWNSSSPDIAAVDNSGMVTGLKKGEVTIIASAIDGSRKSVSVQVNVANLAKGISIIGEPAVPSKGETILEALIFPETADNKNVSWSVSDSSILTIDSKGKAIASDVDQRHEITVTASAQDGSGVVGTHRITVTPLVSDIKLSYGGNMMDNKAEIIINLLSEQPSVKIETKIMPEDAMQSLIWKSSSPKIAVVSDDGLVTGIKKGNATITATSIDGTRKSASFSVNVASLAKEIIITGSNEVTSGRSVRLQASVLPETTDNKKVTWTSSDEDVARVNRSGEITVRKVLERKTVTVTALAQDGSGVAAAYQINVVPEATEVLLLAKGKPLDPGVPLAIDLASETTSIQLSARVYPDDASQGVVWKSSDTRIASVDETGRVTALRKGKTVISATASDGTRKSASFSVNVASLAKEIIITGSNEVTSGRSVRLQASVLPETTDNKKVSWTSSDEDAARVNRSGEITARKVLERKTVTVTALAQDGSGVAAAYQINVLPEATEVHLLADGKPLEPRALLAIDLASDKTSIQLSARVYPDDASQSVVWKSSDTRIASVDEIGRVTALRKGKATITATAADGTRKRGNCIVSVEGVSQQP